MQPGLTAHSINIEIVDNGAIITASGDIMDEDHGVPNDARRRYVARSPVEVTMIVAELLGCSRSFTINPTISPPPGSGVLG